MTKLLEKAIEELKKLPAEEQDKAAVELMQFMSEEPETGDREAIETGVRDFRDGNYVTLEQWQHEMGVGGR